MDERKKGRPRDLAVSEAIEDATRTILARDGYQTLSIIGVAKLSGVSAATIYRRFPSKEHLVVHVIQQLYDRIPLRETSSLRQDLTHLTISVFKAVTNPIVYNTLPALLSVVGNHSVLGRTLMETVILPRRQFARDLVQKAINRGEVDADIDPDMVVDAMVGFVFYRVWTLRTTVSKKMIEAMLNFVLRGAGAKGH